MDNLTFAGTSGVIVLVGYAVLMLVIGYFAGRKQPNVRESAKGYYLAGGGLGFVTLFFTLYATQYSGNSVVGYAPEAYRSGFSWWQSVGFMIAVIVGYLLFAPRLYVIAKRNRSSRPPTGCGTASDRRRCRCWWSCSCSGVWPTTCWSSWWRWAMPSRG
ncbi:hypothetical protein ACFSVJ_12720 [Prauserella oleivorans]